MSENSSIRETIFSYFHFLVILYLHRILWGTKIN